MFIHYHLYGTLISIATISCLLIAQKIVTSEKKDVDVLWGLGVYALFGGLVGARLYHVLHYIEYYSQNPIYIFAIWNGGLGIIGGIIVGTIMSWLYLRRRKENVWFWTDLGFLVLPVGQTIARWGNYFNQELYGVPTNMPWGIFIQKHQRLEGYEQFERFHPLFFYESLGLILIFILLLYLYKTKKLTLGSKKFTIAYLIGYFSLRYVLEFFKIDAWHIYGLNTAQIISILVITVCAVALVIKPRP